MRSRGSGRRFWCWALLVAAPILVGQRPDAQAIGAKTRVRLAELRLAAAPAPPRAVALERLAWELAQRTSVDVAPQVTVLQAADPELFAHPLVLLAGDRAFPLPEEAVLKRWRRFLTFGGLLWIDGAEPRAGQGFDRSVRALVRALLPESPLVRLTPEHTLFKSFYLLERAVGRVALLPYLEGVERDGRLVVVYGQNDLAGAWARDAFGQWELNVYPGGEAQRELAIRWGVNVVLYALTLDYKSDQVHIPFVLKRRRWRADAPVDLVLPPRESRPSPAPAR